MLKGTIKSAEEITGVRGLKEFSGNDGRGYFTFLKIMGQFAEQVIKIQILSKEPTSLDNKNYDYKMVNNAYEFLFRKEWLKDIYEEIDWSIMPVDTKVIVYDKKRYFAKFEDGKVYTFCNGETSWSTPL